MKKFLKISVGIMWIAIVIFSNSVSFAGMADWTREDAEREEIEQIKQQDKEMKDREGKSDNSYLSDLQIENYDISPVFDKDTTNYKIEQEVMSNTINIKATPEDSKSKVDGGGEKILNTGINNLEIKVTAENGFTRIYYIIVFKGEEKGAPKLDNIKLSAVDNENSYDLELSPQFDSSIYSYNCEINSSVERISIDYGKISSDTTVEIIGDYSLPEYENEFTIKVSNDKQETTLYKILVYNKALSENHISHNIENKNETNYLVLFVAVGGIGIAVVGFIILKRLKH